MTGPAGNLEFSNVLDAVVNGGTGRIKGVVVCEVVSFQRSTQTATVRPQVTEGGEQLPDVELVPVVFPGVYWDVQAGTFGALLVAGVNWRKWWRTGQISAPEDDASHELTNGLFLPDLRHVGDFRDLDPNTSVLLRPSAGGEVRLGTYNASKAAVHEDAVGDILTWAAAVSAAITLAGQDVTAALLALQTNLPTRVSPSVMVED